MPLATQNQKQDAAQLVAKGKLTNAQIAHEVGVSLRTIGAWRATKEFQQQVRETANLWRKKVRSEGPADRDSRLRDIRWLRNSLVKAIVERGKDPAHQDVPGYKTGMVTVRYKMQSLGEGKGSAAVREYEMDTATPLAIIELLEKAAVERGHRDPKKKDGATTIGYAEYVLILNAGRDRAAAAKAKPLESGNRIRPELQSGT